MADQAEMWRKPVAILCCFIPSKLLLLQWLFNLPLVAQWINFCLMSSFYMLGQVGRLYKSIFVREYNYYWYFLHPHTMLLLFLVFSFLSKHCMTVFAFSLIIMWMLCRINGMLTILTDIRWNKLWWNTVQNVSINISYYCYHL